MSRFSVSALLTAVCLFAGLPAFGQNATGSLSGTVTDSSGAVIPKAQVTLINQATNSTRDTVANGSGFFNFAAVQPATYTVKVSAPGFTSWEEKDIEFTQAGQITLPNISLQVGSSTQTVQVVSAADVLVPTDNGQTSQTLNEHMINELSIQGRDAAELIKIMPGMGNNNGLSNSMWNSLTTANNSGPIGAFSASGTQPNGGMTMTLDGANLLDPGNQGTQTANVNQNQTAEVTILTSAYDASFAKGPVTFQAIGKSGGDHFHGQAYFYARNGMFSSEDAYLRSQGTAKPEDSYYYPGGDFGGPVLLPFTHFNRNRDKLFFYAAYENMRQSPSGTLLNRFIPTADMMGQNPSKNYLDFTAPYLASLGSAWAGNFGANVVPTSTTGQAIPANGQIPINQLDPNSLALWKLMPKPNVDPVTHNGYNYQTLITQPVNRWEVRLRGDYNISDKHKLFFSWNRQDEQDLNPISVWWYMGNALPYPSGMPANQQSNVYSANLTSSFSPTLTNEFIFGDATFVNPINLSNPAAVNPANVGFNMTGLFKDPYTPQLPNTVNWAGGVPGYSAPTFGTGWSQGGFGKLSQAPSISDNITKVWGVHTIKAGFYWDSDRNNQTSGGWNSGPQGTLEFENYGANTTNNEFANFATGRITGFNQTSAAPIADFKFHQYSFYVNDQWKAMRRLTLTLGIRADHIGAWYPLSGPGLAVWNPSTYNNTCTDCPWTGMTWHALNKNIPISGFPSRAFFPEPRVGIAYDVFGNGKTILRGGFGVYRYQFAYNSVSGGTGYNAPLGVLNESTTWSCCIGYNSFNQFTPSLGAAGLGTTVTDLLLQGDDKTPYTESYNFTISQQGPWRSVFEFSYAGNQSHDLLLNNSNTTSNIDKIAPGAFYGTNPITGTVILPYATSGFNANDYYPLHQYTGLTLIQHGSYQYYNSLQVSWQKQTGKYTFTTNYTFGKVLGIRDGESDNGGGNGNSLDPFNLRNNYGVLAYDHTHIFNAAYVVNLPSPLHGNKILAGAVNGWELSGITQLQSGAPIQPNTGGNLNAVYGNAIIPGQNNGKSISVSTNNWFGTNAYPSIDPLLTCDPRSGLKSGQYFNPSCFTTPAFGQQGNFIWPYVRGPAFFNSDLSVYKNFAVHESQKIQLRLEAFNFLNHPLPQFNANGGNADLKLNFSGAGGLESPTNTNIDTTGKPLFTVGRRVVEFAIKYEF